MESDGSRVAVDHEVATAVRLGVVCHMVECLHILEGEDVYDAPWVVLVPEPDIAVAPEVSDCVDKGLTPAGPDSDGFIDAADVGE